MSTGLDKVDLEKLFDQNSDDLRASRFYRGLSSGGERSQVAIYPFKNETTEHIGPQLQALLSKMETQLVKEGVVTVISHERQQEILGELKVQQSDYFDKSKSAEIGRQLGVKYFITGKVYDAAERTSDVRRVQYFFFMQAINVETGAIEWQNEAELTKALVPLEG
jgi:PBP1b-binding outer membrane lipoprotein LpoB